MEVFGIKIPAVSGKEILTFFSFLGLLAFTIRETTLCVQRYLDFPKYTSFELVYQDEVDFPSLTFCPKEDDAYRANKLEVHLVLSTLITLCLKLQSYQNNHIIYISIFDIEPWNWNRGIYY